MAQVDVLPPGRSQEQGMSSTVSSPGVVSIEQAMTGSDRPVKKHKSGRKPVFSTPRRSDSLFFADECWKVYTPAQRKEKLRQAQADFRDRRTEYIKRLEDTVQQCNCKLESLQLTLDKVVDERLTLRYKNSLLERILVEFGEDLNPSIF